MVCDMCGGGGGGGRRREEEAETEQTRDTESKTRTPHKVVGKKSPFEFQLQNGRPCAPFQGLSRLKLR